MKQFLLLSFLVLTTSVFAQNTVKLNINHELGNLPFAFNTGAQNNLGHDFNLNRMEYYLSQFTIVHDGGQETNINSVYALVDASEATTIDLGSHNVTTVEAIKFYIGVDSATNHLDPASYPGTHALAPKSPSMHWGWASGYRFAALEGKGSSNYSQTIELHGLGDNNYYQAEVLTSATAANNEVIIDIYADYTRALESISVNVGAFEHGFDGDARKLLFNFSQNVFQQFSTSTIDFSEVNSFKVFPNPTTGQATISLEATEDFTYQVLITDVLGKTIEVINEVRGNQPISTQIEQSGLYFVQLVKDGQTVISKKLLVQ
jgi:hypothetical protein